MSQFQGTEVSVAEIEDYVLAFTPFRTTQYKKQVLAELEREEKIVVVNAKPGRRARSYADPALRLRFEARP